MRNPQQLKQHCGPVKSEAIKVNRDYPHNATEFVEALLSFLEKLTDKEKREYLLNPDTITSLKRTIEVIGGITCCSHICKTLRELHAHYSIPNHEINNAALNEAFRISFEKYALRCSRDHAQGTSCKI